MDRRRNSTVTRSNEIDRWKIRIEEEMDEINAGRLYLRSLHSTFELSSFFATMEEEIPPWKDRRSNSTVSWSNEILRYKIRIEEEIDELKVCDTYVHMQCRYNILRRYLHFLLVANVTVIGVHLFSSPLSLQRCKKRSHREWIEEEIRPSPDRMR